MGATAPNWADRAAVCERCPLRVIRGGISYCGTPFLEQIDRTDSADGCGCPTGAKAKDPAEHCPLDARHQPARTQDSRCTCKWCALASGSR
jgi:hypothetical protein